MLVFLIQVYFEFKFYLNCAKLVDGLLVRVQRTSVIRIHVNPSKK
jgi:hypothetical protein